MIDYEAEIKEYTAKLDALSSLIEVANQLPTKDQEFAADLISTFTNTKALSSKQWLWVERLAKRITATEPIYGNFDPIRVAFQLAGEHIKMPRIRLLTKGDRYVQLNFYPDTSTIKVFVDGWQGHGYRKFAGTIDKDRIIPNSEDRMTDEVKSVIQDLSLDPLRVAKAMANKLGCCMYCGQRLSDRESKARGYGPICAEHYALPWGNKSNEHTDTNTLFMQMPGG